MPQDPAQESGGRSGESLDPADWTTLRQLGHRMLDDAFDQLQGLREGPVWRSMPAERRHGFGASLPREGAPAEAVYEAYLRLIAPYATGNRHPGFFGWVHGGGTPVGDAFSYGFRVSVPEDCVGDVEEGPHVANLRDMGRRYADVLDLQTCLDYIASLPRQNR